MFLLGQAVVVCRGEDRLIGEIVGVRTSHAGMLYRVELEDLVLKGVFEEELAPASAQELQAVLAGYAFDPRTTGVLQPTKELARLLELRKDHVGFLERALASVGSQEASDKRSTLRARFAVGDAVAVAEGSTTQLGLVRGLALRNGEVWYELDVQGSAMRVVESQLAPVTIGASARGLLELGCRARFLVPGHEQDDDYVGIICAIDMSEGAQRLSLMFDDGDILEDLTVNDVQFVC